MMKVGSYEKPAHHLALEFVIFIFKLMGHQAMSTDIYSYPVLVYTKQPIYAEIPPLPYIATKDNL